MLMGFLLIWGIRALTGLLNKGVTGLGSTTHIGINLISIKRKINVSIVIKGILMVCLTNLMHASICLLLWWWYDKAMAWSIFCCLQNCLNWSYTKFMPASETIFFGSPNSANAILAALVRSSAHIPSAFFTVGNLL